MHSIYIEKVDSNYSNLEENILKGLEFVDWEKYIKKDTAVFVKPNFCFPSYKPGITTSPQLLRCLLKILRKRADTVIVGESDGGNRSYKADKAFEGHNMYEICKENDVELVNLSKSPSKSIEDIVHGKKIKIQLPKLLLENIDCFISVPVLKLHAMSGVTLSIKNLWGCWPDTMRGLHHQNLELKLALMTKVLNPKIVVVDAIYALDGHGPLFGTAKRLNLMIIADNPVVADSLGAALMGIPVTKIKHIMAAEREGLGTINLENIKVNSDWRQHKMQFQLKRTLMDRISRLPFDSDFIAKATMDSSLTPLAYKVVRRLRSSEENDVIKELGEE